MVSKLDRRISQIKSADNAPENIDMKETCFRVLGKDMTMPISVTMTEKTTVQRE